MHYNLKRGVISRNLSPPSSGSRFQRSCGNHSQDQEAIYRRRPAAKSAQTDCDSGPHPSVNPGTFPTSLLAGNGQPSIPRNPFSRYIVCTFEMGTSHRNVSSQETGIPDFLCFKMFCPPLWGRRHVCLPLRCRHATTHGREEDH